MIDPVTSSHEPGGGAEAADYSIPTGKGLFVVSDESDWQDWDALARAAGFRLLGVASLAQAADRLDRQANLDLVLLRCRRPDPLLERLLVQLETLLALGETDLVIDTDIDALDLAFALARSGRAQLLCQPDRTDLAAALLAVRVGGRVPVQNLHDLGREGEGTRLALLSEEVGRLARTLEELTRGASAHRRFDSPPRIADRASEYMGFPTAAPAGRLTATRVRDLLRVRRLRGEYLSDTLFADPAWDMLLDLLAARLDHERVSVSSLCIASAVPPTTALRWIRTLADQGLVERQADPHDGRRVFIALAPDAAEALERWFVASQRVLGFS